MKRFLKYGVAVLLVIQAGTLFAEMPSWWVTRGIVNTNAVPNDYAPVNQGQVKHIAYQAYLELKQNITNDCFIISNLVAGFSFMNNYLPANLGQLKTVAQPFYDLLWANNHTNAWPSGMTVGPYPWSGASSTQDYAIANIGQLKYLFSLNVDAVTLDSDHDGLPDWWEIQNGLNPLNAEGVNGSNGDPDRDDLINREEFTARTDPIILIQTVIFCPTVRNSVFIRPLHFYPIRTLMGLMTVLVNA